MSYIDHSQAGHEQYQNADATHELTTSTPDAKKLTFIAQPIPEYIPASMRPDAFSIPLCIDIP
jgi:hypothetical protein